MSTHIRIPPTRARHGLIWRQTGLLQVLAVLAVLSVTLSAADSIAAGESQSPPAAEGVRITADTVTPERIGLSIPASAIGEPVAGVTLSAPRWFDATPDSVAFATVDGQIAPVDPGGWPIHFRILLPADWNRRAIQMGGGGMNGMVPGLRGERPGSATARFARYGSDSGHQMTGFFGGGDGGNDWALNDEAIRNLGYLQMKKTHDAALIVMERVYGERPRFNYYIGSSQGGREALTVAQRYPADYDGIVANVPIVSFSSLMLAPELIRIQEKPLSNWVTPAKANAIRAEFIRQTDKLDGLADGVINNYMAARALFDMSQGDASRDPWAALRAPQGVDPDPADTSTGARLTDGQIETLKLVYSRYPFATPLANGVQSFGMWVPNTDPAGSGLIARQRFRGQEGAADDTPMHAHLGVLGVTGFLMRDLSANPLDYVEGGALNQRREQLAEWLDSTDPDLSRFCERGGKMIVTIGTNDTLASPGAQLDYFQSVLDTMGRATVDSFARFYVLPQTDHGLSGRSAATNGDGDSVATFQIPNQFDRTALIIDWVERGKAPGKTLVVRAGDRSLPLCSYPNYPRYRGGPPESANSYESATP